MGNGMEDSEFKSIYICMYVSVYECVLCMSVDENGKYYSYTTV